MLWAAADASPQGFLPGAFRLDCVRPARAAPDAVALGDAAGDPFAAAFVQWSADAVGWVSELIRCRPELFLVIEGEPARLPEPSDLGPWVSPDRCLSLGGPLAPHLRRDVANHLGSRWRRERVALDPVLSLGGSPRPPEDASLPHRDRLNVLYGIVEKVHDVGRLDAAVAVSLAEMARFLGARTGSLLLLDGEDRLEVAEAVGPNRDRIIGRRMPLHRSPISRHALVQREPVLVADMQEDPRFRDSEDGIRFRARSVLSVPLFAQGEPLGVLHFGADAGHRPFTAVDRDLVVTLGRQITVAVEKNRLLEGLQQSVDESIQALAGAIEAKDPYTRGHSDRVRHYAQLVAAGLGLDRGEAARVARAATLHDVGKIGVPEVVLNKPGRLTAEEHGAIQRHPEVGVEIVREIRGMEATLELIRSHHERFDGKGYPHGLHGDDIPLGARILAVADTFDAMISDRPYRAGLSVATACEEIERCAGAQFDPEVARTFLDGVEQWGDPEAGGLAC